MPIASGVSLPARLAGAVALLLALACGEDPSGAGEPHPTFELTLAAEGGQESVLRGDSAIWRNDGSPYHRSFQLALYAPAAPAGFPVGRASIEVVANDSALAAGPVPITGRFEVNPPPPARATTVVVRFGEDWRGTALDGALRITRIEAGVVSGSLGLRLSVLEGTTPRPDVRLAGEFTARAWEY